MEITGSSSALTGYQVLVTADTASLISAGKLRSDCGDLRFTDTDGATLLDYWIESGCNSASTQVWVEAPSIPTGGTTIYMYYGNSSASSASNGTNTFEFFDDFEGTELDADWTTENVVSGQLSYSVSDSHFNIHHQNGTTWHGKYFKRSVNFAGNFALFAQMEHKSNQVDISYFTIEVWDNSSQIAHGGIYDCGTYSHHRTQRVYGVKSSVSDGSNVYQAERPYRIERLEDTMKVYIEDVERASNTATETITEIRILFQTYASYGNSWSKWDIIRVRKYASPEPETCAGGEETHSDDCNSNGIPDESDIAGGTSSDINSNGIPDECEPPDVTPPQTSIVSGPADGEVVNVTEVTFEWTGTDNFTPVGELVYSSCFWAECDPSAGPFSADTSYTFHGLDDGVVTIKVVSRDLAGNVDPTPVVRSFTVDLTPPEVVEQVPMGDVSVPVTYIYVTFSEAVNAETFTVDDIILTGPGGGIAGGSLREGSSSNTNGNATSGKARCNGG